MQVSARTLYAVRTLFDIAYNDGEIRPVTAAEIAERQEIPSRYLEEILALLKKGGYIKSRRGVHGGYVLAMKPEEVTLAKVLTTFEGPLAVEKQLNRPGVRGGNAAAVAAEFWVEMEAYFFKWYETINLRMLLDRGLAHGVPRVSAAKSEK